jgi:hypothetical protein
MSHSLSGRIHSIYRKTINLSVDGRLLAIQASGSPLSPISLITDMTQEIMESFPFYTGQNISIQKDMLVFHDEQGQPCFSLSYDHADFKPLKLEPALTDADLDMLKEEIWNVIWNADTNGFDMLYAHPEQTKDIPMLAVARGRLLTATNDITQQNWEEAALELTRLIGLGIGLTPSGDDFLTGVLAGLMLRRLKTHPFTCKLKECILAHLSDTNDISSAFLRCALDGHYSLPVNMLTSLPKADAIFRAFSEIGHSSGIDSLCGIYFVLDVMR